MTDFALLLVIVKQLEKYPSKDSNKSSQKYRVTLPKDTPWKEHQGLHRWRRASGMALGRHDAARLRGTMCGTVTGRMKFLAWHIVELLET